MMMTGLFKKGGGLAFRTAFGCAQTVQPTQMLLDRGELSVRNSESLEIRLFRVDSQNQQIQPLSIPFEATATLKALRQTIQEQMPFRDLKFLSQQNVPFSELTPAQSLVTRSFTISSPDYRIRVEGQLLHPDMEGSKQQLRDYLRESLKQVEQPVFIQRDIENYLMRVQTWINAKYPEENAKIPPKQAKDILVQALADPDCPWGAVRELEKEWRKQYNEVAQLRGRLEEAVRVSEKLAKRRMYLDLVALAANIGFIWGGTYVVYSWDIIEPWAYFISSAAGIYLFRKAGQFRKPFSLPNYREHLIYEVYLERAAVEVGLDLGKLREKQRQLKLLETTLKDHLISKL